MLSWQLQADKFYDELFNRLISIFRCTFGEFAIIIKLPHLSADMMTKNIDEVNCVMLVDIMYRRHMCSPKIHSPRCIVYINIGTPMRKNSSANARLRMYKFVTVFILLNLQERKNILIYERGNSYCVVKNDHGRKMHAAALTSKLRR